MTRLVFMDTETTGLQPDADVWDLAFIVRDPGVPDLEHQTFVLHDTSKALALPDAFRKDWESRYSEKSASSRSYVAEILANVFEGGAHVVGAVPDFDTLRLGNLMRGVGIEPTWHYHLIDVETLAVGYLYGRDGTLPLPLPWDSDELSAMLGVVPPVDGRHTALGDARWVRDLYDAVTK